MDKESYDIGSSHSLAHIYSGFEDTIRDYVYPNQPQCSQQEVCHSSVGSSLAVP